MSTIGGNLTWQMSSSWWAESSKMTLYHAATVLIRWPVSGTACLQWLTVGWTLAWPGYTAGCLLWVVPHLGRTWLFSRRSRDWTLSLTPGRKRLHLVQVKCVCEWSRGEGEWFARLKKSRSVTYTQRNSSDLRLSYDKLAICRSQTIQMPKSDAMNLMIGHSSERNKQS